MGMLLKVLTVFILILSIIALVMGLANFQKRELLIGRTRTLEEKIKALSEKKKAAPAAKKDKPRLPAELANLEESFRESLGTKVSLAGTNTRGKITIEYFSREDLERVFEKISGKE